MECPFTEGPEFEMTTAIYILGAPDPEMTEIEALLHEHGAIVVHARTPEGNRVTPAQAYWGWEIPREVGVTTSLHDWEVAPGESRRRGGGDTEVWESLPGGGSRCTTYPSGVVLIECSPRGGYPGGVVIDHHRVGDPGYARPRGEAVAASSLGQLATLLGVELTPRQRVIAALDHCLPAALRGECQGVSTGDALREVLARPGSPTGAQLDEARGAMAEAPRLPVYAPGGCQTCEGGGEVARGYPCPTCTGTGWGEVAGLRDLRQVTLPPRGTTDRGAYPGLALAASMAGEGYVTLVSTREEEGYPAKLVMGGEVRALSVQDLLDHPERWVPAGWEQAGPPYGVPARGFGGLPLRPVEAPLS